MARGVLHVAVQGLVDLVGVSASPDQAADGRADSKANSWATPSKPAREAPADIRRLRRAS